MLDVAVAYNRFKFLGDEFLTWLWFVIDNHPEELMKADKQLLALEIGNRIVLENRRRDSLEKITIKGDQAGLEEGLLALKKGALVTELNLVYRQADKQWQFTVKGESLNISNLKIPDIARPETKEDIEGYILEKIYLYQIILDFIETAYNRFIKLRVSKAWSQTIVGSIKQWLADSS